nr:MAG TPA: hypothetical protein [Herelleviridae sp.]
MSPPVSHLCHTRGHRCVIRDAPYLLFETFHTKNIYTIKVTYTKDT